MRTPLNSATLSNAGGTEVSKVLMGHQEPEACRQLLIFLGDRGADSRAQPARLPYAHLIHGLSMCPKGCKRRDSRILRFIRAKGIVMRVGPTVSNLGDEAGRASTTAVCHMCQPDPIMMRGARAPAQAADFLGPSPEDKSGGKSPGLSDEVLDQ